MVKPVEWTQDGYPVFTDPAQFQAWEKQRREETIEEIQEAFNDKAYETMVQIYGAEVKRLGDAIEDIENRFDLVAKALNLISRVLFSFSKTIWMPPEYDELEKMVEDFTKWQMNDTV